MNIGKISVSNIRYKPLSAFLSIMLLAFGVGIIIMLMGTTEQLEKQFTKNIKGIDMVVGAKGSPWRVLGPKFSPNGYHSPLGDLHLGV